MSFKSALDVLDKSPTSEVSFPNIFSPLCGLPSHFLDIIFYRTLIFDKVLLPIISLMAVLLLYQKSHCHTQVLTGFLLCYLLVLQYCILHLGLRSLLDDFCEGCKVFVKILPFFLPSFLLSLSLSLFLAHTCPVLEAPLVEKIIFLTCTAFALVKKQVTVLVWVCFWTLESDLCAFVSTTLSWLQWCYSTSRSQVILVPQCCSSGLYWLFSLSV